jgi:formylglycine-generating enzyme required for sulfatase activity
VRGRPRTRAPGLAAAALAFAAGCAGADAAGDERSITIDNPGRRPLLLWRVVRDGFDAPVTLGDARSIRLTLEPGRYALSIDDHEPSIALPLLPRELDHEPPTEVRLVAAGPPPGESPGDGAGFVWIPPGPTIVGDELGVGQESERPPKTPHVPGFELATHETTNADYVRFLDAERLLAPADEAPHAGWLDFGGSKCRITFDHERSRWTTDAPDLPVVTVAFAGAVAYCDWLTRTTGRRHRLPSEAEWEKAARGPGSRTFAYGDTYRTAAANQESGRLRAVGSFSANGFGLFDMTGNAFEWTADVYRRPGEPVDPDYGALRGGSFVLDGIFVRNSMRMRLRRTVRADDVGFRVLREER